MSDGYLDTNVLIHALLNDEHSEDCRVFLARVERGEVSVRLESYVVHELSFVLGRVLKQLSRTDVAMLLSRVIEWPGIECERTLLLNALDRWQKHPGLGLVDALLATQAARVFTINTRDFADAGVETPSPLSSYVPSSRS